MRVAFVVGTFPKLSKTFILSQIIDLIDRGHEVDIYALPAYGQNSKLHSDIEKYNLLEKIYRLSKIPGNPLKRLIKAIFCLLLLAYQNPRLFVRLLYLPNNNLRHKLDAWICSSTPSLERRTYDIIHCHFAEHSRDALLIKTISSPQAKIVTTFHGYDVNVTTSSCNPEAYREIFTKGDIFTANTSFTAKKASLLGCPAKKIKVLPVGLDISKYAFLPRSLQPGQTIRILTVGRLVEKKGIDYSLRAVAKAQQQMPDLNLEYSIIGEGEQKGHLEILAEELNISNKVKFLGGMTQEEVKAVYDESHIFVLSSITASNGDMEGQALVLQEAQCVGLPVISTLHNGIPDGVLDGKSGFLVPEKDVDSLAEKLVFLALNPSLWAEMGQAGHQFVRNRYNIKSLNNQLIEIYENLLTENPQVDTKL